VTTDEGPYVEDLFWLLHAADGTGCLVPHAEACEVDLLSRLQQLSRFDNMAVVEASRSTGRQVFVCWEGAPRDGEAAREEPNETTGGPASARDQIPSEVVPGRLET